MASGIRNAHDANHGTDDDDTGLEEEGADDRSRVPEGDCANWPVL